MKGGLVNDPSAFPVNNGTEFDRDTRQNALYHGDYRLGQLPSLERGRTHTREPNSVGAAPPQDSPNIPCMLITRQQKLISPSIFLGRGYLYRAHRFKDS